MSHSEAWIDLLATAVSRLLPPGPVVVLHEAHRVFPLVESCRQVGWIQAQRRPFPDFMPHGDAHPSVRLRLDARAQAPEATALLRRAAMRLLCIPQHPRDAAALLSVVEACVDSPGEWLIYGAPDAAGWSSFDAWMPQLPLLDLADSPKLRVLSTAPLKALWSASSPPFSPALATHLCQTVPANVHLKLELETPSGLPRLRLRVDPLQLIACTGETLLHHVITERRALINARGLGSVMIPWDGCQSARMLLRNVRARVDDCEICIADHALSPADLQYTEKGAVLSLRLPMLSAGRDALLHLSLPRPAVPSDGFCDIGAAEFIADLA